MRRTINVLIFLKKGRILKSIDHKNTKIAQRSVRREKKFPFRNSKKYFGIVIKSQKIHEKSVYKNYFLFASKKIEILEKYFIDSSDFVTQKSVAYAF